MDNAQKAIMIGVGLFITIIIIAAVMLIAGMGQDMVNEGTQQLSQMSAQLQKQLTQDYDGTTMTGAQVLAAVKKYHSQSDMVIEVINVSGQTQNAGGLKLKSGGKELETNSSVVPLADFSNNTKTNSYIVTTAQYKAELIKINDAVVGIRFTK